MKLTGIQTLRGIAANLVILYHCFAIGLLPKYGYQSQFESFIGLRNFWSGVDLFFCISGYVMCYSYLNSTTSGWNFFRARIIRVVPIYWIFTSLVFASSLLMGSPPDYEWFIQSLIFSVNLENRFPILAVGWTLQYEMFFYLSFAIVLLLFKTTRLVFLSLFLLFVVAILPKHIIILEFFFGCVAYLLSQSQLLKRLNFVFLSSSSVAYIGVLFLLKGDFATNYRVIFFGIPAIFIVASMATAKMPKKFLQHAGSYSYSLYLIHFPLLSIYFKMLNAFEINLFPAWFLIVIAVGTCNATAFITWKYIESPLLRALRHKFLD